MRDPWEKWGRLAGWQKTNGLWLPGTMPFVFTPNCCCGQSEICEACLNAETPTAISFTTDGITFIDSEHCASGKCAALNGTWTVDFFRCNAFEYDVGKFNYEASFSAYYGIGEDQVSAWANITWSNQNHIRHLGASVSIGGQAYPCGEEPPWSPWQFGGVTYSLNEYPVTAPFNCHDISGISIPCFGSHGCAGDGSSCTNFTAIW